MKRPPLSVWLHGQVVATLTSNRPGQVTVRYTDAALDAWPGNTPLMSCSLPLRTGRLAGYAFTAGLLPEGHHRQAMAGLAGVPTHDVIGLLRRFGRDVAGALVISEDDPPLRQASVEEYTDADLQAAVDDLFDHPLGLYEDSELSIAGLADKMLLTEVAPGRYGRPRHGATSTHILKVDDRTRRGLVAAEHACLDLAHSIGLPAADSTLTRIGDTDCIIVTRFDRTIGPGGTVERIHQEDACQALGIDPEESQRKAKYEASGGPSFTQVAQVLSAWAPDPASELLTLADLMTFTVLIGNADAHGKNIAFLHPTPGQVRLAPAYDTVPTVLWPRLRARAAMRVAGKDAMNSIDVPDLVGEASRWGLRASTARARMTGLLERAREALDATPPATASEDLLTVLGARTTRLLDSATATTP